MGRYPGVEGAVFLKTWLFRKKLELKSGGSTGVFLKFHALWCQFVPIRAVLDGLPDLRPRSAIK